MHLGGRNKRIEYHMHKEGAQVNLETTELEKDLGVYADTKLTFSMHCEKKGKYGEQTIRPDQKIICVP